MTDTTMCASIDCHSRKTCLRNEASGTTPHPTRQSWANFDAGRDDELWCDHYVEKPDNP